MEVKKTPLLFQQELNTFYKDVLNCEITHPRYREGRVPETFFLRKRRGIDMYYDRGGDEVLDYVLFAGKEYALVKDGVYLYVKVKGANGPEIISRDTYNANVNHSFKEGFQNVKGSILTSGSDIDELDSTDPDFNPVATKVKDATANWTVDAYVGKYVLFISSGDTSNGAGIVSKIHANTSNILWLETGTPAQIKDCAYKIFNDYGECLAFVGGTYVYSIANDQVQSSTSISDGLVKYEYFSEAGHAVVDADWNDGRLFVVRTDGAVICSATTDEEGIASCKGGMDAGYVNSSSVLGYVNGAIRIIKFNNIMVLFTKNKIYLLKKVTLQSLNDLGNSFTYDSFQVNLAFGFLGLHSMKSLCSYNTGIYILSNKNTFLSLNIEETYYNYYRTTTEDMGVDIQQWLDNIGPNDPVSIGINAETIYITWKQPTYSTIFQYDVYYKFRHRWETQLSITNINVSTDVTYMGEKCYRYNLNQNMVDYVDLPYDQKLRFINGDSDVFSLKTILYHKLYLGPETDRDSYVLYKARLSTQTYKYKIPFNNVDYLNQIDNLSIDHTLGESLHGYQVLGGLTEDNLIGTLVSDVDVIDIPLGLTYSILEITIVGQFEIGGNLLGALVHDDHITPYEDVVPYFNS